jgi:hypothetical protein
VSRTIVITGVAILAACTLASLGYARTAGTEVQALRGPYLGSYTATVTLEQATARGESRMAGRYTLELMPNGRYVSSNPLDGRDSGRLAALANHRLRFYDDRGCKFGGFERPQGGIYRWSLSGTRLTLRLVNEGPCTGRTQTLTYPVWIRR